MFLPLAFLAAAAVSDEMGESEEPKLPLYLPVTLEGLGRETKAHRGSSAWNLASFFPFTEASLEQVLKSMSGADGGHPHRPPGWMRQYEIPGSWGGWVAPFSLCFDEDVDGKVSRIVGTPETLAERLAAARHIEFLDLLGEEPLPDSHSAGSTSLESHFIVSASRTFNFRAHVWPDKLEWRVVRPRHVFYLARRLPEDRHRRVFLGDLIVSQHPPRSRGPISDFWSVYECLIDTLSNVAAPELILPWHDSGHTMRWNFYSREDAEAFALNRQIETPDVTLVSGSISRQDLLDLSNMISSS